MRELMNLIRSLLTARLNELDNEPDKESAKCETE